jgi:hypothetical protein
MRNRHSFWVFLQLMAIFSITRGNLLALDKSDAPVYQEGESWQFNVKEWDFISRSSLELNGSYQVEFVGGQFKAFDINGGSKAELSAEAAELLMQLFATRVSADMYFLKFPLVIDAEWKGNYTTRLRGGRSDMTRTSYQKVSGVEEIAVPAGKFFSFKINRDDTYRTTSKWIYTYYYSSETKCIVQSSYDSSLGGGTGGKREIILIKYQKAV